MSLLKDLLKPYKFLFKDSSEEPKEVGVEEVEEEETPKPVEQPKKAKLSKPEPEQLNSDSRAGKVLWKKK